MQIVPGKDEVFTPPYAYTPDPTDKVKELVTKSAGAGRPGLFPDAAPVSANR